MNAEQLAISMTLSVDAIDHLRHSSHPNVGCRRADSSVHSTQIYEFYEYFSLLHNKIGFTLFILEVVSKINNVLFSSCGRRDILPVIGFKTQMVSILLPLSFQYYLIADNFILIT